jgi:hypothetical protein
VHERARVCAACVCERESIEKVCVCVRERETDRERGRGRVREKCHFFFWVERASAEGIGVSQRQIAFP